MSSKRKLASARANGAKSQGPITPEGRKNSALAAVRHGILAKSLCLTIESEPALLAMVQGYTDHFQPVGPVEIDLIESMAVAKWQEHRIWTIQTATLDLRLETQLPEIEAKFESVDKAMQLAIAFNTEADTSKALALQLRYANAHRRAYEKSLNLLLKLQASREDVAYGSSLGQATADPPPEPPAADAVDVAKPTDPVFSKEPNPIIEHPLGVTAEPTIDLTICPNCGRTVSPKWNTCNCGRRLRS